MIITEVCYACEAGLVCIAGAANYFQRENMTLVVLGGSFEKRVHNSVVYEHITITASRSCPGLQARLKALKPHDHGVPFSVKSDA